MSGDSDLAAALAATDAAARARLERIAGSPGFVRAPRVPMVDTLDEDTLTFAKELAEEAGVLAFAALPEAEVRAALERHFGTEWGAHAWDVYEAPVSTACAPKEAQLRLPDGWRADAILSPDDETVLEIARLNQACGVSPNPGSALRGDLFPVHTVGLFDAQDRLRASATVQMIFPEKSRLGQFGFLGLISVDPQMRGLGLGTCVTAHVLQRSAARLGYSAISAWVAPDNPGSVALMRAFGLTRRTDVRAVVAMPGGGRFTR